MNSRKLYKHNLTMEEEVSVMEFTALIRKSEKFYVATCLELGVTSQGKTSKSALKNLKEAVELYVEEMGVPKQPATITRFALENAKIA